MRAPDRHASRRWAARRVSQLAACPAHGCCPAAGMRWWRRGACTLCWPPRRRQMAATARPSLLRRAATACSPHASGARGGRRGRLPPQSKPGKHAPAARALPPMPCARHLSPSPPAHLLARAAGARRKTDGWARARWRMRHSPSWCLTWMGSASWLWPAAWTTPWCWLAPCNNEVDWGKHARPGAGAARAARRPISGVGEGGLVALRGRAFRTLAALPKSQSALRRPREPPEPPARSDDRHPGVGGTLVGPPPAPASRIAMSSQAFVQGPLARAPLRRHARRPQRLRAQSYRGSNVLPFHIQHKVRAVLRLPAARGPAAAPTYSR